MPTPAGDVLATPADEYFSSVGIRTGSSSGSAVVMSSPDGRPFGMFFEPPVKADRRVSNNNTGAPRRSGTRKFSMQDVEEGEGSNGGAQQQTRPISPGGRRSSALSANGSDSSVGRRNSAKSLTNGGGGGGSGGVVEGLPNRRRTSRRDTNSTATTSPIASTSGMGNTGYQSQLSSSQQETIFAKGRAREGIVRGGGSIKRKIIGGKSNSPMPSPAEERASLKLTPEGTGLTAPVKSKELGNLEIPLVEAKAARKKVRPDDTVVVPPINVLIVEDNPINQNILSMFLKKKKIKHQTAKDGEEAVRKWQTGGFHLILMDIQLPVKDGIEATREIRDLERNSNIGVFPVTPAAELPRQLVAPAPSTTTAIIPPSQLKCSVIIVALTASSLQTDRINALAAGCNDFLTKPVSLKWLEQKIIEWGCMQALIDFDGWRRWKSIDPKESETRKGFQTGPLAAAKSLAGRLKINPERRSLRQSSTSSTGSSIIAPDPTTATSSTSPTHPSPAPGPPHTLPPKLHVQTATPVPEAIDSSGQSLSEANKQVAAEELEKAREDLMDLHLVDQPVELVEGGTPGDVATTPPEIGRSVSQEMKIGGEVGVSERPDLRSIVEGERVEKPLPPIPGTDWAGYRGIEGT